jgi:exonuclease III
MLLVSWNVAGRVKLVPEQAARLAEVAPDVVCLQEVRDRALPLWRHALASLGLEHIAQPPPPVKVDAGRRRLAVLTAAREPLGDAGAIAGVPWPERVLATRIGAAPLDALELVNVHSPISPSPRLAKVRTHEAVHAYLAERQALPCVLCGDLNTPRRELADGTVWTFARDRYGRLRADRGERWDQAELALIRGLEPYGYRDAFRTLHGYDRREPSWEWPRWGGGYRLDHLIVSSPVRVTSCGYLHEWRRRGLSDHSALIAEIAYDAPTPSPS